jgi:hypothetical protein
MREPRHEWTLMLIRCAHSLPSIVASFLGIDGMDNDERGRTELDEDMLTSDVPDDALERLAAVTDGQVVTVGHCTHWYHCGWPL